MRHIRTKAAPTRWGAAWFSIRVSWARVRRAAREAAKPLPRLKREPTWCAGDAVAEIRSPLWTSLSPAESRLELGKVQNLRAAARRFDGIVLEPGAVFSFWRQLGPTTKRKGFVAGRQLQEGCLISNRGGGICQLSNSLYEGAIAAGLQVLERHRHTKVIRGSAAERGKDATVAWNHVDLRFRSDRRLQLSVRLTREELIVSFLGDCAASAPIQEPDATPVPPELAASIGSCDTCNQTDCFRHAKTCSRAGRTVFLVDEAWPEFVRWIGQTRRTGDRLFAPLDGGRWRKPQYRWPEIDGTAWIDTLRFGRRQRGVSEQGAIRQRLLLDRARSIAERFASQLSFDETGLVIQLPLLPFLWMGGHLGGRRFVVLMTRSPIHTLQSSLDAAFARFPERGLLADFRAPTGIADAEREALEAADRIVTPNPFVAQQFGPRAELIPWNNPPESIWTPGAAIGFPGPATARKGAYEVREAALTLGLEVVLGGRNLEGDSFWGAVPVRRSEVLDGVFAVVQPALLEDRPRALLRAAATGCPVICTKACGLGSMDGVHEIGFGEPAELISALQSILKP